MEKALMVLNPNASQTVTDRIDAAIAPLRAFGIPVRCLTLKEGPPAIESQRDADLAVAPMLALAARLKPGPGALSSPVSATPACTRCATRARGRSWAFKRPPSWPRCNWASALV